MDSIRSLDLRYAPQSCERLHAGIIESEQAKSHLFDGLPRKQHFLVISLATCHDLTDREAAGKQNIPALVRALKQMLHLFEIFAVSL